MRVRQRVDRRTMLALLVAVALLVVVAIGAHRVVGWDAVARAARTIPAGPWIAFALLMAGSYAARACRLWTLARRIDPRVKFGDTAPVFLVHNAIVTFVPARLGEAAMPVLAHRWAGLDWRPMIGLLAWWRLADLTVVAAIALVLLALGATALAPLLTIAAVACAMPFAAFALRHVLARHAERMASRSGSHRAWKLVDRVVHGMPATWSSLATDLVLATLAWCLKIAALATIMRSALGADAAVLLSNAQAAACAVAGETAGAMPIPSVGSVGPYEAGMIAALTAFGVATERAFAIALLVHGALLGTVIAAGACGGVLRLLTARTRS